MTARGIYFVPRGQSWPVVGRGVPDPALVWTVIVRRIVTVTAAGICTR
jgi:hypothetical protein